MSVLKHRELCLASVLALALTGAAGAADLPVKAPIVVPVPVFSWTGIYIGLSGGAGWGTTEYSYNQDPTLAGFQYLNPFAFSFGTAESSHDLNGGFFGGQIGANWQIGWAVLGIQADWYWSDFSGKGMGNAGNFSDLIFGGGTSANIHSDVNNFGSVTGRIGTAFDRVLVYAKGGVAWMEADYRVDLHGHYVGACSGNFFFNVGGACNQSQSVSQRRTGFTFGTGVEVAFDNNWSAFVEYDYYDFDTEAVNYAFSFVNNQVSPPVNTEVTTYLHTVKAGINYKFNWWGGPGVIARY